MERCAIDSSHKIRANDPNNIIVVGTPNWSQYVDEASNDPITGYSNIAYTLHYYAGTHKQDHRNRAIAASNKNLPIFVTEYGTVNADGNGAVDTSESGLWWDFCDQNKISYVNWAIDDKSEGSAALVPRTTAQQVGDDSRLTASGIVLFLLEGDVLTQEVLLKRIFLLKYESFN